MPTPEEEERDKAINDIVSSDHARKLLLAGAGAGKTSVFKKLLDRLPAGDADARIVVTFINELTKDLDDSLGELASVGTLHSFCRRLLHQHGSIRGSGLTADFEYFPKIRELMGSDWRAVKGTEPPKFANLLRDLGAGDGLDFFLARATYYDAVGFDDSIVRVHRAFAEAPSTIPAYDLVIVDEFQDFNRAEVELLKQMALVSAIVVAGDDDQALYGQLRRADERFIRELHADSAWKPFPLPFSLRCPSVIVRAVNDLLGEAQRRGLFVGRINKPYKPFPREVDATYPRIKVVRTTVQALGARNYMGRYVARAIDAILPAEIAESYEKKCSTVLIIGATHYLRQVKAHLESAEYAVEVKDDDPEHADDLTREDGLRLLKRNPHSNLGWRILLDLDHPELVAECVVGSAFERRFVTLLSAEYRSRVLDEVDRWAEPERSAITAPAVDTSKLRIKLVTFEGSKGLSAQHVFIIGAQAGVLPRGAPMKDVDVARFVVALTRTRKQCHVLYTNRFSGQPVTMSPLIAWIDSSRTEQITVNAAYW